MKEFILSIPVSFLIQFIIFWIVGIFLSIFTHEIAHLIVVKLAGWKIEKFKPWPHKQKNREWVAGSVYYKHYDKNMHYMPYVLSAPVYKSFILFHMWLVLGIYYYPLWALAATELMDYLEWWAGYLFKWKKTDGFILRCLMVIQKK